MKYLILFLISFKVFALGKFESNSHQQIYQYIQSLPYQDRILVVYDLDNTVMKSYKNFGSDQWFQWQKTLLGTDSAAAIAQDFKTLIQVQTEIFTISKMETTEFSVRSIISKLQEQGKTIIALTSRGPEMRNVTERELKRLGVNFDISKLGSDIAKSFIPTNQDRVASYLNGIFMTSGMHKGLMLQYLLERFKSLYSYKHIVFIDDHKKHTDRVYETFMPYSRWDEIEIDTFRYGHEDNRVRSFHDSNKDESIRLGAKLQEIRNALK